MADFSHLKKLEVPVEKKAIYRIEELDDAPELVVCPATEANKPFFNAMLRRSRKMARVIQSGNINVNTVDSNREEDRELYAKYVILSWSGIVDAEGKPVEFSPTLCLEFLKALPDYIFDGVRQFASNPVNFLEDTIDADETAKN